ncbi:MAG: phytoene desaturase family protein [Candidatus Limnocylindrales bacterium]
MAGHAGAWDAIVVGSGHNGLTAAAYLARGGLRTLVLERRDRPGGAAVTDELLPGVRVPTLAHTVGRLRPDVYRELDLRAHGLTLVQPEARVFAPQPDGRAITLWADAGRTAEELRAWSAGDAAAYREFDRRVRALATFLGRLAAATPPDIGGPSRDDALAGLRLGLGYRGLGRRDGRELLRVLAMAVADLVGEAFETEPLRATLAARGVLFTAMGPWSGGTAAVLLADSAGHDGGAAGQAVIARGGPGALSDALAAAGRVAGAELRLGAEVTAITARDGAVTGVVLADGEEIAARVVASGIDPRRTLTGLVDPVALGPRLGWRAGHIRQTGMIAKVNLVLDGLPTFVGADAAGDEVGSRRIRGRLLIGAPSIDALERVHDDGKYGRVAAQPWLEATIPTLLDPTLAPDGRHVMSVIVQGAPRHLRAGDWAAQRSVLGDRVLAALEAVAPGIGGRVRARQVITPEDLERDYGLGGGHPFHAEPGLDQWFAWRPLVGAARYRLPLRGLYLVGSGAHPGGGVTAGPGANAAREILADSRRR